VKRLRLQAGSRREPYEVLTATSGAASQELLERHYVDVVVSDEQMPGMSGSVFLAGVRKAAEFFCRSIEIPQISLMPHCSNGGGAPCRKESAVLKEAGRVPLRRLKEFIDARAIGNVFECTIKTLLHSTGCGLDVRRRLRP
jgi:hypothetical protein